MWGSFQPWLDRWGLVPDGEPFETPITRSRLAPVRQGEIPAMLKLVLSEFERDGGALMAWWNGEGAAPVLERDDDALLLKRATGRRSLADMARSADDDEASRIACETVAQLHAPRQAPPPALPTLAARFAAQAERAASQGGVFRTAWAVVGELLDAPREMVVLHGDVHHGNILDFGADGWLAIDPQGVVGERGYDYANLFKNPDCATATAPGRLARQVAVVAEAAQLEPRRLLQWILAHAALSACWSIEDGHDPSFAIEVAEIAKAELGL
jgi:streptomycin 6-kinase